MDFGDAIRKIKDSRIFRKLLLLGSFISFCIPFLVYGWQGGEIHKKSAFISSNKFDDICSKLNFSAL